MSEKPEKIGIEAGVSCRHCLIGFLRYECTKEDVYFDNPDCLDAVGHTINAKIQGVYCSNCFTQFRAKHKGEDIKNFLEKAIKEEIIVLSPFAKMCPHCQSEKISEYKSRVKTSYVEYSEAEIQKYGYEKKRDIFTYCKDCLKILWIKQRKS